jgi:hypothetical protein
MDNFVFWASLDCLFDVDLYPSVGNSWSFSAAALRRLQASVNNFEGFLNLFRIYSRV